MKLEVKNINAAYGDNAVLQDINIEIHYGEFISLVGTSGVGKTTLFNIIAGLMLPGGGDILLDGEAITGKTGFVGYMLQKDMLLPYKTVIDNIALPLVIGGENKKNARQNVLPYLEEFGLKGYEYKYPASLSGGMRQRAAFLRTYMQKKQIMLLDEPFSAIDSITRANLHEWYSSIAKRHKLSTILITHDIEEAIALSDRVYIMSGKPGTIKGELTIVRQGALSEFLLSDKFLDYKRQILGML
ncbi:MAG: ABC transporter ATP-binding protein [Clostridium sp.]|nr:ABC transporter ATP-binding protein [Clostridium sp.]